MLEPLDVVIHLRDQEFDEHELISLLNQMVREQRTDAANKAAYKVIKSAADFRGKRNRRLCSEFRNVVLTALNDDRRTIKWERQQGIYRENRKQKKQKEYFEKKKNDQAHTPPVQG